MLYPDRNPDEVIERFNEAGPSARLCLEFSSTDLKRFYGSRTDIIDTMTVTKFERLLQNVKGLSMDHVSHKIAAILRENPDEMETYVVHPVSEYVYYQLRNRIYEWDAPETIRLLKRFSRAPDARSMTGVLFEVHYHLDFAREIILDGKPMFRTDDPRSRWHGNFGDFSSNPKLLKAYELHKMDAGISLNIKPKTKIVYDDKVKKKIAIKKDVYYIPKKHNQCALDSFIVDGGNLYFFQFTGGAEHLIKSGFEKELKETFSGLPPSKNWYFFFVVPQELSKISCPHYENGFLDDHTPYTAKITVGPVEN